MSKYQEWRKSNMSKEEGNCVQVALGIDGSIGVRDSKLGDDSPILKFTRSEMKAFIAGVHAGEFDDLT